MPSGQLDQISEAIGELKGSIKTIEKYIHEERHGYKDVSAKIDGFAHSIGKDLAAAEARIDVKFEVMGGRVGHLEADMHRREGAIGLFAWFARHWPFTVLIAALAALIAWANGVKAP